MKAVVTAGGRIAGAYARESGTNVKALVAVRGVSMLDRILDALRGAGATRIAVVGGEEVRAACRDRVELFVDEAPTGAQNLLLALRAWPDDGQSLIYATSDMPYVTTDAVGEFLARVPDGHVALPLAEIRDFEARFPGAPPCGITLAGECVVNGDVFYVPASCIERVADVAGRLFDARKHPWQMARLIGPRMLVRFLFRRLGIAHLERHAHRVLGAPAIAVRGCRPELAFDADTAADYRYASTHV